MTLGQAVEQEWHCLIWRHSHKYNVKNNLNI